MASKRIEDGQKVELLTSNETDPFFGVCDKMLKDFQGIAVNSPGLCLFGFALGLHLLDGIKNIFLVDTLSTFLCPFRDLKLFL